MCECVCIVILMCTSQLLHDMLVILGCEYMEQHLGVSCALVLIIKDNFQALISVSITILVNSIRLMPTLSGVCWYTEPYSA